MTYNYPAFLSCAQISGNDLGGDAGSALTTISIRFVADGTYKQKSLLFGKNYLLKTIKIFIWSGGKKHFNTD